jgi:hypothetical protein
MNTHTIKPANHDDAMIPKRGFFSLIMDVTMTINPKGTDSRNKLSRPVINILKNKASAFHKKKLWPVSGKYSESHRNQLYRIIPSVYNPNRRYVSFMYVDCFIIFDFNVVCIILPGEWFNFSQLPIAVNKRRAASAAVCR